MTPNSSKLVVFPIAQQLSGIIASRRKAMSDAELSIGGLEISTDPRTNSLILIGTPTELTEATELLERLDQSLKTQDQTYTLRYYSPQRLDEVIRQILSSRPLAPPYQSRVEGNLLIVSSTPEVLELVVRTLRQLDTREAPDAQSPIRFYKIRNVPAQELLETIRGIGTGVTNAASRPLLPERRRTTNDAAVPGPNVPNQVIPGAVQPIQIPPAPPAFRPGQPNAPRAMAGNFAANNAGLGVARGNLAEGFEQGFPADLALEAQLTPTSQQAGESLVGAAEVTVDIHTNTIIVVAPPEVQRIYATLIETLDKRRPQVLIEAQIVIIDTRDNYTLGVEVSGGDRSGVKKLFSFSSYGLSNVNPVAGALQIIPGVGFNGTLVARTTADVVVRALANHRRARVLSAPRVLVNDNSEGQLTSVAEVPFTSVNASQTVATTSFAGFAEAGTTITVTPTIRDDNYLQLDYIVPLNSFTGAGTAGVPPPRQTNEVRSRVTVADGHTVIVGGLNSKNDNYRIDSIPWLEKIPVIRELSSLQTRGASHTSLFVFLKPIILREDRFKDLKFVSEIEHEAACLPGEFPATAVLTME